jgi:23S rRNA (uridine2552-2'-O)-methyltransferase
MTYRRKDAHYRRARAEGYRARSAYKLAGLDRRYRLLAPGQFVVDLGAWPGGWLQVTRGRVGERGRVVGLDLVAIEPLGAPNVTVVTGDVRDPAAVTAVRERLGRPADVVLSDLAPKLTGVRATDEARSAELAEATLAALPSLLRPGGRLVMKVFMGPHYEGVIAAARRAFAKVTATRAEATRPGSAELYVIGTGYEAARS